MELSGGVNCMTFHPDRETAHSEPGNTAKEFSYYPMGFGKFSLNGDINDVMGFNINIERDNVLQNSLKVIFSAKTDHFMIEFGPFAGVCDDFNIPDAGIVGAMQASLPGIISLTLSGFITLGTKLEYTSDNSREGLGASLRFWFPKMILTASVNTKSLSRSSEDDMGTLIKTDALTKYMATINFYTKGSPVMVTLEGGYQTYSRTYSRGKMDIEDKINSYFGGFELEIKASEGLKIKAGVEIPFFITAEEPMTVTPEFLNLSKFIAGFIYTFNGRP